MTLRPTTNFKDSNGVDLGQKLVPKDYLISVYPSIGEQIGIPPELWTWGYGGIGQLGNRVLDNRSTPVTTFTGGTNWKQISAGREHVAAIKTDGTLWTWGRGDNGVLGTNDGITRSTPVTTFAGGNNWKQVSMGNLSHAAAIKTDGTLWLWGDGSNGVLGNGIVTGIRSTPVTTFAGGTNWKQVSAKNAHTAAIKTDGTLWLWGQRDFGKLGNADISSLDKSTPITTFAGGTDWKQVDVGGDHTVAIKTDGTLWVWGYAYDFSSQSFIFASTPTTTFAGGTNWKQVSAGNLYTAAIKTDGTLWTWGYEAEGQLGTNSLTDKFTPVTTFAGGNNWKQVSANGNLTVALKTDGTLWTWGSNAFFQLGNAINFTSNRSTPVTTFAGGNNWKQVSSGSRLTMAIRSVDF